MSKRNACCAEAKAQYDPFSPNWTLAARTVKVLPSLLMKGLSMNRLLPPGALLVLAALAMSVVAQEPSKANGPKLLTTGSFFESAEYFRLCSFPRRQPPGVCSHGAREGENAVRATFGLLRNNPARSGSSLFRRNPILAALVTGRKQLAFLSDRDEQQQLYVMRAVRWNHQRLTKGKRGVKNFALVSRWQADRLSRT